MSEALPGGNRAKVNDCVFPFDGTTHRGCHAVGLGNRQCRSEQRADLFEREDFLDRCMRCDCRLTNDFKFFIGAGVIDKDLKHEAV